jgi:hypothetical protein
MPDTAPKLSNTARNVLTLAAARDDHLVRLPKLPVAAARQVIRSLLNAGLVEEIPTLVEDAEYAWRTAEDDTALMLQATAAGLAGVSEPGSTDALSFAVDDREADQTLACADLDPESTEVASPPAEPAPGPMAFVADALDTNGRGEDASGATIEVDAGIASLVNAFVHELMKQERPPFIARFLRRLEGGGVARGTAATGTKRAREMSASQRKIVELLQPAGRRDRQGTGRGVRMALDRGPRDLSEDR